MGMDSAFWHKPSRSMNLSEGTLVGPGQTQGPV